MTLEDVERDIKEATVIAPEVWSQCSLIPIEDAVALATQNSHQHFKMTTVRIISNKFC